MSTQRQRKTKARRDRRRVRFTLKAKKMSVCPQCAKMKQSHQACPFCGHYKGKEVVKTIKKVKKKK